MKIFFSFIFLLTVCFLQGQNSVNQKADSIAFDNQVKQYILYKKYMYIDYIPKEKIPSNLKKNFYSNLSPETFTHSIGQDLDTINKVHRLYLTTNRAGQGFLDINKGALQKMPIDNVNEIIYVLNNDTVKTYNQMSDLISLKNSQLNSVDYKKIDGNKLVIDVRMK